MRSVMWSNITLGCTVTILLVACGGGDGGGGGSSGNTTAAAAPSATVSGFAAKGLLLNAIVSFNAVSTGAESTTLLTSVRTDLKAGAFSATVSSSGPVVVTVTTDASTQMLDELSGTAIAAPIGLVLHAVVDSLTNLESISVTPLTEMAYDVALASSGALTTANIDAANNAVSTTFLAGAPILTTQPIDIKTYASATAAQQEQSKFLVALAVAANEDIALGLSGTACARSYSANLVCMVAGLGKLLSVSSSGVISLASAATYLSAAYASIDSGAVTIAGGQSPSAFGLNVATAAETAFVTAIAKQAPLPGYNPGADPLLNTKALFANVRTNILDQATTQTFGYAPTLAALSSDYKNNVHPVLANTGALLSAAYGAGKLIQYGTTNTGLGAPSQYIINPVALTEDAMGNLYVVNGNSTVAKVTGSVATLLAGQAGVLGSADGSGAQASFTNPNAIAVDSAGNVYVFDNNTIRKITSAGLVSTLAGQPGVYGFSNGTGASASFSADAAIAVDVSGNIYVADSGNVAIRLVTPGGVVSTFLSQPTGGCGVSMICLGIMSGIAVDFEGTVYVTSGSVVQKISQSGVISTLAGQPGVYGYIDGPSTSAQFEFLTGITVDPSLIVYVIDGNTSAVRRISAGVVSTLAKTQNRGGMLGSSSFGYLTGITLDGDGNIYLADQSHSSLQEVSAGGTVTTIIHSIANYAYGCGYDPTGLQTAATVAVCRYGLAGNQILLTVTQTGVGTYSLQTQALAVSTVQNSGLYNSVTSYYSVVSTFQPLRSAFTFTTSATGAESATFSGPYYVNASGGQVTGSLSAAESSDWNAATGSGTLTVGGSLSGGAGGVSLVTATLGSDSVITVQNFNRLLTSPETPIVASGSPAVTISGAIDLTALTTSAFSYAVKGTIGLPIYDKSTALALPGTVSITGSIDQIGPNGMTPLFNGTVGASFQGLPSFDATKPISATNFFTIQAQLAGTLSFTGGRVLTVTATANASQVVATAAHPDSISATYSYSTPTGTAELNATGQYDVTDGYSGTINNNSGVIVTVKDPIGGTLTGTVTANGVNTATIKGSTIDYSDGSTESLF